MTLDLLDNLLESQASLAVGSQALKCGSLIKFMARFMESTSFKKIRGDMMVPFMAKILKKFVTKTSNEDKAEISTGDFLILVLAGL